MCLIRLVEINFRCSHLKKLLSFTISSAKNVDVDENAKLPSIPKLLIYMQFPIAVTAHSLNSH